MTKTVITLTSWKKRINYLYNFLYVFFKTQKELPDIFYIWLSLEEFPNKEKDLDEKLVKFINDHNINLIWQEGNEKVFKRWYVYPKHYQDLVISIDDDRVYPFDLIEEAKKVKSGTIQNLICLDVTGLLFRKDYWFCGQSIIPPNTFPVECMSENFKKLRDELNIQCDEAWISPFLLKNKVKILPDKLKFSFTNFLDSYFSESQGNGMWIKFINENYNKFDYFLKLVEVLNKRYNFNLTNL